MKTTLIIASLSFACAAHAIQMSSISAFRTWEPGGFVEVHFSSAFSPGRDAVDLYGIHRGDPEYDFSPECAAEGLTIGSTTRISVWEWAPQLSLSLTFDNLSGAAEGLMSWQDEPELKELYRQTYPAMTPTFAYNPSLGEGMIRWEVGVPAAVPDLHLPMVCLGAGLLGIILVGRRV